MRYNIDVNRYYKVNVQNSMRIVPKLVSALTIGALFGMASVALAFDSNLWFPVDNATASTTGGNPYGHVVLSSQFAGDQGGIAYAIDTPTTFSQITFLSTDYKFLTGSCTAHSPRFDIALGDPITGAPIGSIRAYFTGCTTGVWSNTGNFLTSGKYVDATDGTLGGPANDPYSTAVATYGNYKVLAVALLLDGGATAAQVLDVDNTEINTTVYTYGGDIAPPPSTTPSDKDACKKDSWSTYTRADGSIFKNQGDCIQYVNTGK
jgi:hypothetical protein